MRVMIFVKGNNFEEVNSYLTKGYEVKQMVPVVCPQTTEPAFYGVYVYLEK